MSWQIYSGSIQNIILYETNKYSPGHQSHLGEANKTNIQSPSFSPSKLHLKGLEKFSITHGLVVQVSGLMIQAGLPTCTVWLYNVQIFWRQYRNYMQAWKMLKMQFFPQNTGNIKNSKQNTEFYWLLYRFSKNRVGRSVQGLWVQLLSLPSLFATLEQVALLQLLCPLNEM